MAKPTKEDASLLIQIFTASTVDEKFQKASKWFTLEMNEKDYDVYKARE